ADIGKTGGGQEPFGRALGAGGKPGRAEDRRGKCEGHTPHPVVRHHHLLTPTRGTCRTDAAPRSQDTGGVGIGKGNRRGTKARRHGGTEARSGSDEVTESEEVATGGRGGGPEETEGTVRDERGSMRGAASWAMGLDCVRRAAVENPAVLLRRSVPAWLSPACRCVAASLPPCMPAGVSRSPYI